MSSVIPKESRPRLAWLDGIKALAITLVIIGHFAGSGVYPYASYSSPVKVMLFFAVSGFTFNAKRAEKPVVFLKNKAYRLLIPYVLITLTAGIAGALPDILHSPQVLVKVLTDGLRGLARGTSMWFLPVLFECEVLMLLIVRLVKINKRILVALMAGLLLLGSLVPPRMNVWMNLDVLPVAFGCFLFGYILRGSGVTQAKRIPVSGWVCLGVYAAVPLALAKAAGVWHYMNIFDGVYTHYAVNMLQMLTGVYAAFAIMPHLHIPRLAAALGRNSLFYYGYHIPMRTYALLLVNKLTHAGLTEPMLKATLPARAVYMGVTLIVMLMLAPCCGLANKLFPVLVGKNRWETKPWWHKQPENPAT